MEKEPDEIEFNFKPPTTKILIGLFVFLAVVAGLITFVPSYFQQKEIDKLANAETKDRVFGIVAGVNIEKKSFIVEEQGTEVNYEVIVTDAVTIKVGGTEDTLDLGELEVEYKIELKDVKFFSPSEAESEAPNKVAAVGEINAFLPAHTFSARIISVNKSSKTIEVEDNATKKKLKIKISGDTNIIELPSKVLKEDYKLEFNDLKKGHAINIETVEDPKTTDNLTAKSIVVNVLASNV